MPFGCPNSSSYFAFHWFDNVLIGGILIVMIGIVVIMFWKYRKCHHYCLKETYACGDVDTYNEVLTEKLVDSGLKIGNECVGTLLLENDIRCQKLVWQNDFWKDFILYLRNEHSIISIFYGYHSQRSFFRQNIRIGSLIIISICAYCDSFLLQKIFFQKLNLNNLKIIPIATNTDRFIVTLLFTVIIALVISIFNFSLREVGRRHWPLLGLKIFEIKSQPMWNVYFICMTIISPFLTLILSVSNRSCYFANSDKFLLVILNSTMISLFIIDILAMFIYFNLEWRLQNSHYARPYRKTKSMKNASNCCNVFAVNVDSLIEQLNNNDNSKSRCSKCWEKFYIRRCICQFIANIHRTVYLCIMGPCATMFCTWYCSISLCSTVGLWCNVISSAYCMCCSFPMIMKQYPIKLFVKNESKNRQTVIVTGNAIGEFGIISDEYELYVKNKTIPKRDISNAAKNIGAEDAAIILLDHNNDNNNNNENKNDEMKETNHLGVSGEHSHDSIDISIGYKDNGDNENGEIPAPAAVAVDVTTVVNENEKNIENGKNNLNNGNNEENKLKRQSTVKQIVSMIKKDGLPHQPTEGGT